MEELAPSAYHDPREVVWKHLAAQAYWDILDRMQRDEIALGDFDAVRYAFLRSFDGHHDIELLCRQAEASASALVATLEERGRPQAVAAVAGVIAAARESLRRAMEGLQSLRQVDRLQSYVADGVIRIAGKPAEEFAANPDFIGACLELVGEAAPEIVARARAAWRRGFVVDDESIGLVRKAARQGWCADDMLAEVLMREQTSGAYPSLREYEFRTDRTQADNHRAKARAIEEGCFLLGRLMSCAALLGEGSAPVEARELDDACPVAATLQQAGIQLTPARVDAARQFMLVRFSHGLNPGEFTARIASSVRTTLPQALAASLIVRTGKMHGGAFTECMKQLEAYLAAPSRHEFVRGLVASGELYGFGHRIHKRNPGSGGEFSGGDPRVAYQIARARQAWPEREDRIRAFEELVRMVRAMKPTLAPNTDFGAAVWFHCLGLAPRVAAGIFTLSRVPGLIGQVINQLDYKANALRPPLAVNLPYTV